MARSKTNLSPAHSVLCVSQCCPEYTIYRLGTSDGQGKGLSLVLVSTVSDSWSCSESAVSKAVFNSDASKCATTPRIMHLSYRVCPLGSQVKDLRSGLHQVWGHHQCCYPSPDAEWKLFI